MGLAQDGAWRLLEGLGYRFLRGTTRANSGRRTGHRPEGMSSRFPAMDGRLVPLAEGEHGNWTYGDGWQSSPGAIGGAAVGVRRQQVEVVREAEPPQVLGQSGSWTPPGV